MRRAVPSIWHGHTGAGHTKRLPLAATPPAVRCGSKATVALVSCRRCRRLIGRSPMRNGTVCGRSCRRRDHRQDDHDTTTAQCSMGSSRWWARTCRGGRCRRNTASGTGRTSDIGCGATKGSGHASSRHWQARSAKCPCRGSYTYTRAADQPDSAYPQAIPPTFACSLLHRTVAGNARRESASLKCGGMGKIPSCGNAALTRSFLACYSRRNNPIVPRELGKTRLRG